MTINDKISAAIKEQLENKGYDLVSVNTVFGSRAAVDVFIDRFDEKPVSIDDCVAVSQLASAILDVEDIIQGKYNLNVSSPGETRPLRNEKDFKRFCGGEVSVELENPNEDGKKKLHGTILKVEDSVVYIKEKELPKKGKGSRSRKKCSLQKSEDDQQNILREEIKINLSDIKKAVLHRVFKI